MSRSIHRRTLTMRIFCAYVILVVVVSFAGVGYAMPGSTATQDASSESTASPPPVVEEPAVEEPAVEEPVSEEPPAPDAPVVETVDEPAISDEVDQPGAKTAALSPVEPLAAVTLADIGSGDVNLEGVRKGTGWIKGNLHSYQEGDWVPFRLWVRNSGDTTVTVPQLVVDAFHYKDGKGIYFDGTDDYLYYTTPTEPAIGDPTTPQPGWSPLGLASHDVPQGGAYGVDANGLITTISGGQVNIPPGEFGVFYFRAHLALTVYWNLQDPSRDGWGPYTGSPGNMQIESDFGEKTVPLPAVEAPEGSIDVIKFYDTDRDGVMDEGEQPLSGWTMRLQDTNGGFYQWDISKVTDADGHAVFSPLPPGGYQIQEDLKDGWFTSTTQPVGVTLENGNAETVYIGNYLPEYEKTFEFTFNGTPPANTVFSVEYDVDGSPADALVLTGTGPFTASRTYAAGTVISNVKWYATWQDADTTVSDKVLLGMTDGETLDDDVTNRFSYGESISGHKYEDMDADGVKDPGDSPLENWAITLERFVDGDWYEYAGTSTGADGAYTFSNVLPGTYRISEDLETDWTQSYPAAPGTHEVTVNATAVANGYDFLNWGPASIEGVKFEDLDADGAHDPDEPGLEGWLIYVDYDGDNMHDPGEPYDMTDADGVYMITGVTPGTYSVREVLPGDWFQSVGTYVVVFESRTHYGGEGEYDFGNWTWAHKSGMKFHDLDADGVKDVGEPGLEGWTIFVDYDDDGVHDAGEPSDVTNAMGQYSIGSITPGTYKVREVQQLGWTQSYPASGYYEVGFTSGLEDDGNDFGNWTTASIEGMKFHDLDADGSRDASDTPLQGWTIFVDYDNDGQPDPGEPVDVTDSNGEYFIDEVVPGTWWVREVLETDWTQSRGDFLVEFESDGSYGLEGEYDFGNWTTVSISGYKFLDKNADSQWDAGEPTLSGWTINLMGMTSEGPLMASTVTDGSGHYMFSGLPPGDYTVSEEVPTGWNQSYPMGGGIWAMSLYSGQSPEMSLDFGNWQPLNPWGYKWHDLDADGMWDADEPGLPGWEIHLDGLAGTGDEVHLVTFTDGDGYWQFTDVPPGFYTISEVTGGWQQSYPADPGYYDVTLASQDEQEVGYNFGNWTPASKFGMKFEDLDADGFYDAGEPGLPGWVIYADYNGNEAHDAGEPFAITNASGLYELSGIDPGTWAIREVMKVDYAWTQSMPGSPDFAYVEDFDSQSEFLENDFGNWAPASIEGYKFEDSDADGVWDAGEAGLEGWRIYVDYNGNDVYDAGEPTALTDASGAYMITGVTPGTYEVREVLESDWTQTRGNFEVTFESRDMLGGEGEYDFGNWYAAEKSGTKFEDLDADGVKDPGEPGLPGWTIFVDYDGDGTHDAGEPSDITDANGEYTITGITPGTYMVREVMKVDFDWTQSMPGEPDYAYEETFESSDEVFDNDFGNWAPASITDMKFHDLDADGANDGEPGLAGWTIYVDYNDNGALDPGEPFDVTGTDGVYEIEGITPGTYMVREVMQDEWTRSRGPFEVTFESRGTYGGDGLYDFGNWTTTGFEGTKFHDLDGDGVWDEGEPGLEGWTIRLYDTSGAEPSMIATTSTDADGHYVFEGLNPGPYRVAEMQQEGWTQSYPEGDVHDLILQSDEFPQMTYDFGNWTTTQLSGYKFHDLDADGIWDQPDEEGLIGWLIELTGTTGAGDPFYAAAITDMMGYYEFTDVPPGEYVVSEVLQPYWTQTAPEGDTYELTLESADDPREDLDFGNAEDAEKFFTLTYTGTVPEETTMTVTFEAYGPILEDAGIALDLFGPISVVLEPQGGGVYSGSFDVLPGTVITNVEWWATWNGELIKLGDGAAEEVVNEQLENVFEYDASVTGHKWDDTDLVDPATTLGEGDGVWNTSVEPTEPPLPDWTIQLYRMGQDSQWALYATDLTELDGSYSFDGLLPGTYYLAEVIPLVGGQPAWNQSAGPSGVGDGAFVVADGTQQGPVDFGNWTPIAPLTLDIGIEKTADPTQVTAGATVDYTLTYTMVVGAIFDEPLTIVDDYDEDSLEIIDSNGGVVSNGTITWTFNETLANGESGTIGYTAQVRDDVVGGTRIDNVVVIDMAGDTDPTNNTDDASIVTSEPFLPFTGGQLGTLAALAIGALALGLALRASRRVN